MLRGFLTGFIIIVLAIAFIMYAYGKRTLSNMTTAETETYVEDTTETTALTDWQTYTPPSKKFTVKFPTDPQHALDRSTDEKTRELKQYEMYISEREGEVFMISVISFLDTDKVKDEESTLKNIIDTMVSANPGNKLENIQYGAFEGHKDVDFEITNSSYAISGRAFIDANQLYVVSVLTKSASESKKEFDQFIRSFKLLKNEPTPQIP